MDPPVLSRIGRINLILPMNFKMTTPITPIGPSAFFILLPVDSLGGGARVSVGSEISVIPAIFGVPTATRPGRVQDLLAPREARVTADFHRGGILKSRRRDHRPTPRRGRRR